MEVARGEVDDAGHERAAVRGLDDAQGAEPVQPLGELPGEDGGHVLDDEHRHGEGRRQLGEHLGQGLGATGGGADHEDGGLLAGAGAGRGRAGRRHRGGGADGGDRAAGEHLDAGDELLADAVHRLADAADVGRLGDVVVGAGGEGVEGRGGTALGQRAEHDDRHAAVLAPTDTAADRADRLDAVHLRHLDVHGDQVGLELVQLRDGDLAVHGGAHDLDVRVLGQHVGHDLADDHRVVDDHHPDRVHAMSSCSLLESAQQAALRISASSGSA